MRKTTKSVQRPNPKYRTTFDSAMPLSYIASHYPDVRKCKSGISNPRPGLTPGTALRAVGSGIKINNDHIHFKKSLSVVCILKTNDHILA